MIDIMGHEIIWKHSWKIYALFITHDSSNFSFLHIQCLLNNNVECTARLDSGADDTFVSIALIECLNKTGAPGRIQNLPMPLHFLFASKNECYDFQSCIGYYAVSDFRRSSPLVKFSLLDFAR
jgi:hypothetical protein